MALLRFAFIGTVDGSVKVPYVVRSGIEGDVKTVLAPDVGADTV